MGGLRIEIPDIAVKISPYVLLYAAFSVVGWLMEVVLKYIQYHRFINRGYLIGPYCPIYGMGVLLITLFAGGAFWRKCTPIEAFMVGFIACGALEYFISWYMEKTSHARWWDYSGKPLNINGRVWIGNLTLFGLAAVAVVYLADPIAFGIFEKIPDTALCIAAGAFIVIICADYCVSQFMMRVIRDCIDKQNADNTEEIRLEMHRMLGDRELLIRRILQAYPELQPRPSRLVEKLKSARAEYRATAKRLKQELRRVQIANADSFQERIRQAREAEQRTREKLRKIENDIFGMRT